MGEIIKQIKGKVVLKSEYETGWNESSYIPAVGELVFYKPEIDENGEPDSSLVPKDVNGNPTRDPITYTRQKNGDGVHFVRDLPFYEADVTKEYVDDIAKELSSSIDLVEEKAEQAEAIAKGKNQAKVFDTEQEMLDTVKRWYCIYPGRTLPSGSTIIMSTGGALEDDTEGEAAYSYYTLLSINDEEIYSYLDGSTSPVKIGDRLVCTYVLDRDITIEKIEYEIYAYGFVDEFDEEGNWINATYHHTSFSGPSRLSYSTKSYQYGDTTVPMSLIKPLDISVGDNLYVRELDKPDYWWDGAQPQKLETQKVDLTEYATKEWVEDKGYLTTHQDISGKLDASKYEAEVRPTLNHIKVTGNKVVIDEGEANGAHSVAGGTTDSTALQSFVGNSLLPSTTSLTKAKANGAMSLAFGANISAESTGSFALGFNAQAGIKGYYYYDIVDTNGVSLSTSTTGSLRIILSNKQRTSTGLSSYAITDIAPNNFPWKSGDYISICNGTSRYPFCAQIKSVGRGTINSVANCLYIEVDALPFTSVENIWGILDAFTRLPYYNSIFAIHLATSNTDVNVARTGSVELGWGAAVLGASIAAGSFSNATGYGTIAAGDFGNASGRDTIAGYAANAEGNGTKALGDNSHSEGGGTEAIGDNAHSEGYQTKSTGTDAHSEGIKTEAIGNYSHSEGNQTKSKGQAAHSEGLKTEANGAYSHAGGNTSVAEHDSSFVHGTGLTSSRKSQAVFGTYNVDNSDAMLIVGNGKEGEKANALEVLKSGAVVAGKQTEEADSPLTLTTKQYVDEIAKSSGGSGGSFYIDYLDTALDNDGETIYNEIGWKQGVRLDSSRTEVSYYASYLTGWIKAEKGDIIKLQDIKTEISPASSIWFTIHFTSTPGTYEANRTIPNGSGLSALKLVYDEAGNVTQFTFGLSGYSYFRIQCGGITNSSSITINDKKVDFSKLENRVEKLETFHDKDVIPTYWNSALDAGVKSINTALCEAGRNKSAFLYYTDAHWNGGSKMSPRLLKHLYKNTGMNKTFFGGDVVLGEDASGEPVKYETMEYLWEWRSEVKDLPNHHSVVGNHDDGQTENNRMSDEYVYGYLFGAEETCDIVRGDDTWYYIDNPSEKTRYLFLDTVYRTSNEVGGIQYRDLQDSFVKSALLSTPDNWHIVAIAHIWYGYDEAGEVSNISWRAGLLTEMFDAYNARQGDYTNCNAKVEFCVGGHVHRDYIGQTTSGIPIILTDTDGHRVKGDAVYQVGTTTESCISGIVADYKNNKIKVIRIGRGTSKQIDMLTKEVVEL